MDVSRVRGSFANVVDWVRDRLGVVIVARYGRPLAALVPITRLTNAERKALGAHEESAPASPSSRRAPDTRGRTTRKPRRRVRR